LERVPANIGKPPGKIAEDGVGFIIVGGRKFAVASNAPDMQTPKISEEICDRTVGLDADIGVQARLKTLAKRATSVWNKPWKTSGH